MSEFNIRLDEIKNQIEEMNQEMIDRVGTVMNIRNQLLGSLEEIKIKHENSNQKIARLENEISLTKNKIDSERKEINELKSKLDTLNPSIEDKQKEIDQLKEKISGLKGKQTDLQEKITTSEQEKEKLIAEKENKTQTLRELEKSIEEKVSTNEKALEKVKSEFNEVVNNNAVWDFLYQKMDNPDIEIMSIIAANRGISQDEIKSKAASVSPVFVGRSISKLEADGKITQNAEGLWDLSSSLLNAIQN